MKMIKRQKEFEMDGHSESIAKLNKQITDAKQKAYFSSTPQAQQTMKYLALPMELKI